MSSSRLRRSALTAALLVAGGLAAGVPAAQAAGVTQAVSGQSANALGVSLPTAAVLSNLTPGATSTSTLGTITLVSTSLGGWTLTVKDATSNGGKMKAAATGCSSSVAQLTNPLSVVVQPAVAIGGVTSSGSVSLSNSDQTVASGTGILAVSLFNTNYTQVVDPTDALQSGCVYNINATYTLQ
jgi:hypothetical protein